MVLTVLDPVDDEPHDGLAHPAELVVLPAVVLRIGLAVPHDLLVLVGRFHFGFFTLY